MKQETLIQRPLPQNPNVMVSVPDYKEPILPVNHGGFGWYGLLAYDLEGEKVMCHECGEYWRSLASHIHKHNMDKIKYKQKYGLASRTKLTSISFSIQKKESLKYTVPMEYRNKGHMQKLNFLSHGTTRNKVKRKIVISKKGFTFKLELPKKSKRIPRTNGLMSLEIYNKHDTCEAQLLRALTDASQIYGEWITKFEANQFRTGLASALERRFGSFGKAKQLVRLGQNQGRHELYSKQLILEDILNFKRQFKKYPMLSDYSYAKSRRLICGRGPIIRMGGIRLLCKEAKILEEEQDKRAELGKQVDRIADKVELENAGKARA